MLLIVSDIDPTPIVLPSTIVSLSERNVGQSLKVKLASRLIRPIQGTRRTRAPAARASVTSPPVREPRGSLAHGSMGRAARCRAEPERLSPEEVGKGCRRAKEMRIGRIPSSCWKRRPEAPLPAEAPPSRHSPTGRTFAAATHRGREGRGQAPRASSQSDFGGTSFISALIAGCHRAARATRRVRHRFRPGRSSGCASQAPADVGADEPGRGRLLIAEAIPRSRSPGAEPAPEFADVHARLGCTGGGGARRR